MSSNLSKFGVLIVVVAFCLGPLGILAETPQEIHGTTVQESMGAEPVGSDTLLPGTGLTGSGTGMKDPVTIALLCSDTREVARALSGIPYTGHLGMGGGTGEIISPILTVPRYALKILESTPGVLAILDYEAMIRREAGGLERGVPMDSGGDTPSSIYDTKRHYGSEAWSKGFTGEGINVAVTEFGIDFSQPDLQGTQARVTDPDSSYFGWPIVFDRASLMGYLSSGGDTEETWFVNTSAVRQIHHTVDYHSSIDTEVMWDSATVYAQEWQPKDASQPEEFTVSGLEPGTEYVFAVRAEDEADNMGPLPSGDNIAAAKIDDVRPGRVTDLAATPDVDHGTVRLTWTATGGNGNHGRASHYLIMSSDLPISNIHCFRHLSDEVSNTIVPGEPGSSENFLATELHGGSMSYFAVVAVDRAGNWGEVSNTVGAMVTEDKERPETVTDLTVTDVGAIHARVILNWIAPSDEGNYGDACAAYLVRYSQDPILDENDWTFSARPVPDYVLPKPKSPGEQESVEIRHDPLDPVPLLPGVEYYFAVRGVDELGRLSDIVQVRGATRFDTVDPSQITDLVVETGTRHGCVFLNFTAPGNDGDEGRAAKYVIKYSTSEITDEAGFNAANSWMWNDVNGNPVIQKEVPKSQGLSESFQIGRDVLLPPGTTYYFAIKAEDEADNMGPLSVALSPGAATRNDNVRPDTITDLEAEPGPTHGSAVLTWTAPGDDGDVGLLKGNPPYDIRWSTSPITDSTTWGAAAPGTTLGVAHMPGEPETFTVTGLDPDQLYYFSVRARDEVGLGGYANNSLGGWTNATATNDIVAPGIIALDPVTGDEHGEVKLRFNAPGNNGNSGTALRYHVRYMKYLPQAQYIQYGFDQIGVLNITYIPIFYNVTGIVSQSGHYRIGMHIDENTATYVNGDMFNEWVNYSAVLLVDSVTPYVYDTVYVDLNNDLSFADEKPCRKGDEASHRDMDGDGFADVSGGMIYFIASSEVVFGEALTLSENRDYAKLANEKLTVDSWVIYLNGEALDPSLYEVNIKTGSVTFNPALPAGAVTMDYGYDGLPLPYSERLAERYGLDNVIPRNGELVAFMGEFSPGSMSGTAVASSLAGQGYMEHQDDKSVPRLRPVVGMAPDAKIITVADASFDGIIFALEGYDGIPGTGDEAHIINSGMSDYSMYESGLNMVSHYMDWLATTYSKGRSSIVVSSGDQGYGYGTLTSPGSAPGVITVGLTADFYYRSIGGTFDGGPNPQWGDIIPKSGRGPTVSGLPKPDVVSSGAYFSVISRPLYTPYIPTDDPLHAPWVDIAQGARFATPVTSGALALIYEAYGSVPQSEFNDRLTPFAGPEENFTARLGHRNIIAPSFRLYNGTGAPIPTTYYSLDATNGIIVMNATILQEDALINASYMHNDAVPSGSEAHRLIMSGANDISYDIFTQGAGQINASRSVDLAANRDGVSVTPHYWVPGDFEGVRHEAFVKLVDHDTPSEHLSETFTVMNHGDALMNVPVTPEILDKTGELITSVYTYPDEPNGFLIFNETGFYDNSGNLLQTLEQQSLWYEAELLKITAYNEKEIYWLELYAWTDVNGNGVADGHRTPDIVPIAYGERNRLNVNFVNSNMHEVNVHHPAERIGTDSHGILIWLRPMSELSEDCKWYVKAEMYTKAQWDWLHIDENMVPVPAKGHGTFTATLDRAKALAAGPGTYDGAIKVGGPDGALIPVAINVPVKANERFQPQVYDVQDSILDSDYAPMYQETVRYVDYEVSVANATDDMDRFFLRNDNIVDFLELTYNGTDKQNYLMKEGPSPDGNYTVNYITGEIILDRENFYVANGSQFYSKYYYLEEQELTGRKLLHSNIVPGSLTVYKDGVPTYEYGSVEWKHIITNREDVSSETVITAVGGETEARLAYGAGSEQIAGYTLYLNGTALWEIVDYRLNTVDGTITFEVPLSPDMAITADYYYYDPGIISLQLEHREVDVRFIFIDGSRADAMSYSYTVDDLNGIVTLNKPLGAGMTVEATYEYGTYTPDYSMGFIHFDILPDDGTFLTVSYSYYDAVTPFVHSYMYGGLDGTGSGKAGDWRYFYTKMADGPLNRDPNNMLMVDVSWDKPGSDIDTFIFTRKTHMNPYEGSMFDTDRYGPYGLQNAGGSSESSSLFTASDGGPRDYAVAPMGTGLNVIAMHNVFFNGTMGVEAFSGEIGRMYVSKSELDIVTNTLVGSESFSAYSSLDWEGGLSGIAAGPSAPEVYEDLLVWQDDPDWTNYDTFEDQLASGNTTHIVTLKDCLIFSVRIIGHTEYYTAREDHYNDVIDLDLGVFLDVEGDGIPRVENFVAYDADWDADEEVRLINPPDGDYIIVVYGFEMKTVPAHYDMFITVVQGLGFSVTGDGEDRYPDNPENWISGTPLRAYEVASLSVGYDLEGAKDGVTLQGALYLGPGNAPYSMLMPISLRYDSIAPTVLATTPTDGGITRNPMQTIIAEFDDSEFGELVKEGARLIVNGEDVTSRAVVNLDVMDPINEPDMLITGTLTFTPSIPFGDGVQTAVASMRDRAGNIATASWTFTVDTSAPALSLDEEFADTIYTKEDSIRVFGVAEKGVSLRLVGHEGAILLFEDDGTFHVTVSLDEGLNEISVSAVDAGGNRASVSCRVVYDNTAPELETVRFSTGFITNQPYTVVRGRMNEAGTIYLNGAGTRVNSDGSFEYTLSLSEGMNTIHVRLVDLAGNGNEAWYNVTRDTVAPTITLNSPPSRTSSETFRLTGSVEPGSDLFINGKRVEVGTRQSSGDFSTTLTLSEGMNTIVIEARDQAGNLAELRHMVEYDPATGGVNSSVIGLMVCLVVIGLLTGMLLVYRPGARQSEEGGDTPTEYMPPDDESADNTEEGTMAVGEIPAEEPEAENGLGEMPEEAPEPETDVPKEEI